MLPIAVYVVGQAIFGEYGGLSYGQFFSDLSGRIRSGEGAAWFLVLSPYLGWQTLRFVKKAFSTEGQPAGWHDIDGIRIAIWREQPCDGALRVRFLGTLQHDVAVVMPDGERGMWRWDELPIPLPEGLGQSGIMVMSVTEGSPADDAGLEHGDLIVSLDGEPVGSAEAFSDAIASRQPGDRIALGVVRPGDEGEIQLEVRLEEHPDQAGKAYLGVTIGGAMHQFRGMWDEGQWMPHDEMPFNWDDLRRGFEMQLPPADDGSL